MSSWNYCVTAHKPTNVTHSVVGHFTSPTELNLIIAKCTRIEIHLLTVDGLQPVMDVPIYGRISTMKLFRPPGEDVDCLFFSTERFRFAVIKFNQETGELDTKANGSVAERVGRPTDNGQIGIIDPDCRLIGMHIYDGHFKVIPIDEKGVLKESFNIRLEELQVVDIAFLFGQARPTIAVLFEDPKEQRHLKTYELVLKDKDLVEGSMSQANLDPGACLLIPVPAPLGGCLVVGERTVVYIHSQAHQLAIPMRQTVTRAFGRVDPDGSRYLLSDYLGNLQMLALQHDGEKVLSLKLEPLGETSCASSISYLDNRVVYIGSCSGDSQLVRLNPTPDARGSYVEVLDTFTNLGPIVDMAVVDLERQGQGQVVTCSGTLKDGSLRIVRNGIGINEQATVELQGIKGMWSLRSSSSSQFDKYLVVTFTSETRLLAMNSEEELEESEIPGFQADAQTLACANVAHDQLVQVCAGAVRLVSATTLELLTQWTPPAGLQINLAALTATQILLALGEGRLVYLEVGTGSLAEMKAVKLDHEISCIDINPIGPDPDHAALAAIGLWNMKVCVYALPALELLSTEDLQGDFLPRSVLLCGFEGVPYLLAALGDGHLFTFNLELMSGDLSARKKISLGTQPITLRTFRSKNTTHVFAASDRPTVIYSSNKKLLFSNVNLREVTHMSPFNSASFPDSLALSVDHNLTIGTIDDIQKLHIRTVPLGEQPRRICHQEQTRTFAVCTERLGPPPQVPCGSRDQAAAGGSSANTSMDCQEVGLVRLIDDQTFETLHIFTLEFNELAFSLISTTLAEDPTPYYIVGTAICRAEEEEPNEGRILVFRVEEQRLVLQAETSTKGAVYTLNSFQAPNPWSPAKLLASVNSRVQLFKWTERDGSHELAHECTHMGAIIALYVVTRGDFIIVGDLMRSISLLIYKAEEGLIEERARDYNANWMTAVEVLDDDTYLGAENSFNLFVVKKNSDATTDEERQKLEQIGEYHLGEFVNRFRSGSLVMRVPDSEAAKYPTLLYGTVNGVIGVLASLPQDRFLYLQRLQTALNKVVKGVGGLSHEAWRSFSNERKNGSGPVNFIDGDLIESFLDLKREGMEEVATLMDTNVEELSKRVEELTRLH